MKHIRIRRMLCTALAVLTLAVSALPAASAASRSVRITHSGQVVDTLNGVPARYIPGTGNSNTGDYSCAGYVKAYYSKVYGAEVHNLLTGRTPQSSTAGCSFQKVGSGFQVGDIVYMTNSRGSGHWAIAKAVSGSRVTLIEQNWKWASQGGTYASVDRVVTYGSTAGMAVYRLNRAGQSQPSGGSTGGGSRTYSSAQVAELLFDAKYYANTYADLRQAFGYNASALKNHWNTCGQSEGRTASPIFDAKWYLAHNPDVARAYGATNYKMAYNHFVSFGFAEGRQGSPIFSARTYLGLYPDLRAAFGEDYLAAAKHFLANGIRELRQASGQFSVRTYSAGNPDVARAYAAPLDRIAHYVSHVQYGSERRTCI